VFSLADGPPDLIQIGTFFRSGYYDLLLNDILGLQGFSAYQMEFPPMEGAALSIRHDYNMMQGLVPDRARAC